MEPYGDPEARIRDLERPLADRAGASELGTTPYGLPTPPPPQDPYATRPYGPYDTNPAPYGSPQYSSPYFGQPQRVVRKSSATAALWLIPVAVIGLVGAGIIGAVWYFNLGSPDSYTQNPAPPISGGGGALDAPPTPNEVIPGFESTEQTVTVDPGGYVSIGGIDQQKTIICNGGTVNISGVNNIIDIQGGCVAVTVSGVENNITVDSADTISASGFDNRIIFGSGTPEISKSGTGNVVEQG